ncbi:MAG TPA: hypothetical protein VKZ99_06390 [Gammaproteobacteria bacterium]|nr:hypothetical protein [Gammaproteobacteria bacterium]
MKKILAIALAAAFGAAFANEEVRIADHDQDGDGQLSREEAASVEAISANFDAYDQNQDGQLAEDELKQVSAEQEEVPVHE